jgi:hypothetical protein
MIGVENLLPTRESGRIVYLPLYSLFTLRYFFRGRCTLRQKSFKITNAVFNEFSRCRFKTMDTKSIFDSYLKKTTTMPRPFNLPEVGFSIESLKVLLEYQKEIS